MLHIPSHIDSVLVVIKINRVSNLRLFQSAVQEGDQIIDFLIEIFSMRLPKIFHLGLYKKEIPRVNKIPNSSDCAVVNIVIKGVRDLQITDRKIGIEALLHLCKNRQLESNFRYIDKEHNVFVADVKINAKVLDRKKNLHNKL